MMQAETEAKQQIDILHRMRVSEEADITFLLQQLGFDIEFRREIVKSFRNQIIIAALAEVHDLEKEETQR